MDPVESLGVFDQRVRDPVFHHDVGRRMLFDELLVIRGLVQIDVGQTVFDGCREIGRRVFRLWRKFVR